MKRFATKTHVTENKDCGGIDGETIENFKAEEDEKMQEILMQLKNKEYKPTPVKRTYIFKKTGGKCPLGIPVIQR